jgi:predicted RNA-binding Zn ribbon-like protein
MVSVDAKQEDGRGVSTVALPSWASHLENKLAPPPLLLVQAFVDTLDLDLGTDMFARPEEAHAWLADAGLIDAASSAGPASPAFASDLHLVREVRASIRALIAHSTSGEPVTWDDLRPLEQVGREGQPRLRVASDGHVSLEAEAPAGRVAGGLLGLLLIIRDAQADGSWDRLKACGNPDCRWAFYDRSHSHRGAWCDMASCGNRVKNRNLRARRAQLSGP